ncbi:MAG: MOP flippase family protein [Gammaproteobacteria bacterium]
MDLDVYGCGEETLTITKRQTVSGIKWSSVSQAVKLGAQLLGIVILARLLPASDFGLVAMATVVTGFASLFRDMGTAAAVIQRQDIPPQLLDSVFWFNAAVGLALMVLLAALAPAIAWGFSEPRLTEVLWVLAVVFPLASTGAVHQALLERASRFRPLALLESIAALGGLAVAVGGAWAGWGVYSLVAQTLVSAALATGALWLVSKWRPGRRGRWAEIQGLLGFSGNLVGFNIFNYFARNADNLLIGRFLGAADLGIYSMAYRLMLWPLQNISAVMSRALLPTFSRLQEKHDHFGAAFVQATGAIIFITAPLMVGVFVLREPLVILALGERWKPVSDLLFWLAPVGLLQSVGTTVGSLYVATGRTDVMFKWGIFAGSLAVLAIALGLPWGIEGVAIAYLAVMLLLFPPSFWVPFRLIGLKLTIFLQNISLPILLSAVMGGVVYIAQMFLPIANEAIGLRFGLLVALGMVIYALLSLVFQRTLVKRIYSALVNR